MRFLKFGNRVPEKVANGSMNKIGYWCLLTTMTFLHALLTLFCVKKSYYIRNVIGV